MRKQYVDGLKGILCVMIMLGHYTGVYKCCAYPGEIDSPILRMLFQYPAVQIFFSESLWLHGFFLISGYLLSSSRCESPWDVLTQGVKRFFRLLLPIAGACAVIAVIYGLLGLHNEETGYWFSNPWLQVALAEKITLTAVLLDPIRTVLQGKTLLNTPYWVISDMFYASFLIYALSAWKSGIKARILFWPLTAAALLLTVRRPVVFGCVLGAAVGYLDQIWTADKRPVLLLPLGLAASVVLYHMIGIRAAYLLLLSILLLLIQHLPWLERMLSSPLCTKLGALSFGIYSLHWPIFLSAGCGLLCILCRAGITGLKNLTLVWSISVLLTFLLAWLYSKTIEKWAAVGVKRIDHRLRAGLRAMRVPSAE